MASRSHSGQSRVSGNIKFEASDVANWRHGRKFSFDTLVNSFKENKSVDIKRIMGSIDDS